MSEEIALAAADLDLARQLLAEVIQLRDRYTAAIALLERLDHFLLTYRSQPELIRARQAAQLRREIAEVLAPPPSEQRSEA